MLHLASAWFGANLAWIATAEIAYWAGLCLGQRRGRRAERTRFLRWMECNAPPPPNAFPGLVTMPEDWDTEGHHRCQS